MFAFIISTYNGDLLTYVV